ncbi:DUF1934 domain-containing protein [Streptococcus chenjunshii]|uniref:DUF1934 domain-containing protein n=1 Tax=Streptococcus chenjunshii TaxID=2173853 RepID=A0A372KMK7_9STRE|nr:DUF1934 domain-containing protein [Streptococcus chenjunshii]AXQ79035.1 DUF1934 domain-containing protein [Streptococcus chenjunshii]RFU51231.1 DUF1934 domain-containing protein [Streptococcus chenjunshii]RFU53154.1 DUF1934 domain-containing protein [Streptococcus chenjunshii]
MQIEIKNTVQTDGRTETICETHDCQFSQKKGTSYIIYHNAEKEQVLLKYRNEELAMIRYSKPKSIMTFRENHLTAAQISTPLGSQKLLIETENLSVQPEKQRIIVDYTLKQAETEAVFANYHLAISWYEKLS